MLPTGQVEYIFTDKTGTLTQNRMEFRVAFVKSKRFGSAETEISKRVADRMAQLAMARSSVGSSAEAGETALDLSTVSSRLPWTQLVQVTRRPSCGVILVCGACCMLSVCGSRYRLHADLASCVLQLQDLNARNSAESGVLVNGGTGNGVKFDAQEQYLRALYTGVLVSDPSDDAPTSPSSSRHGIAMPPPQLPRPASAGTAPALPALPDSSYMRMPSPPGSPHVPVLVLPASDAVRSVRHGVDLGGGLVLADVTTPRTDLVHPPSMKSASASVPRTASVVDDAAQSLLHRFLVHMSISNTIQPVFDDKTKQVRNFSSREVSASCADSSVWCDNSCLKNSLQATSPDELALAKFAVHMGYELVCDIIRLRLHAVSIQFIVVSLTDGSKSHKTSDHSSGVAAAARSSSQSAACGSSCCRYLSHVTLVIVCGLA